MIYKNHNLSKELLEILYCQNYLTDKDIGKKYNLTGEGIAYYRKKYGIKTISAKERFSKLAKRIGLLDFSSISDNDFKSLYEKHGMMVLGRMFGCSKIPIRNRLCRLNVAFKSKQERIIENHPKFLTDIQKELIIGSLLGDGGVYSNNSNCSARFKEMHAIQQKDYLIWKQTILLPFSKKIHKEVKHLEDGRIAEGFSFVTCYHPLFQIYRDMFYLGNKKIVPNGLMDIITPFSIAIWYADDGHLSDETKDGTFTIASNFDNCYIEEIVKKLNDRFNFDIDTRNRENITILKINNKQKFFDIIGNHIIPSMAYKIPLSLRFNLPYINKQYLYNLPERLTKSELENPSDELIDNLTEFWQISGFPYPKLINKQKRLKEFELIKNSKIDLSKSIMQGNTNGCSFCLSFFDNIWTVKRYGKKSPMEIFNNKLSLKHAIRDCLKYRKNCCESNLRNELKTFGGVQTFRPLIAKLLYDKYCPKDGSILDPCAGWGSRLLGFYCSNASKYVGIDACPETVKNLKHMQVILNRDIYEKNSKIIYDAFEDWKTEEKFDLIFTSPPYFCKEIYGEDDKQSSKRYRTYDSWKSCFLEKLIEKSYNYLKKEGILIINIANIKIGNKYYLIADDTEKILKEKMNFVEKHEMIYKNIYNAMTKSEPIFVFKK